MSKISTALGLAVAIGPACKPKTTDETNSANKAIVDANAPIGQARALSVTSLRFVGKKIEAGTNHTALRDGSIRYGLVQCVKGHEPDAIQRIQGIEAYGLFDHAFVSIDDSVWVTGDNGVVVLVASCSAVSGSKQIDFRQLIETFDSIDTRNPQPYPQALYLAIRGVYNPKRATISPQLLRLQHMAGSEGFYLGSADRFAAKLLSLDEALNPCRSPSSEIGAFRCIFSTQDVANYAPGTEKFSYDQVLETLRKGAIHPAAHSSGFALGGQMQPFGPPAWGFYTNGSASNVRIGNVISTNPFAQGQGAIFGGANYVGSGGDMYNQANLWISEGSLPAGVKPAEFATALYKDKTDSISITSPFTAFSVPPSNAQENSRQPLMYVGVPGATGDSARIVQVAGTFSADNNMFVADPDQLRRVTTSLTQAYPGGEMERFVATVNHQGSGMPIPNVSGLGNCGARLLGDDLCDSPNRTEPNSPSQEAQDPIDLEE